MPPNKPLPESESESESSPPPPISGSSRKPTTTTTTTPQSSSAEKDKTPSNTAITTGAGAGPSKEASKKQIPRLFNEEDEIEILKSLIHFNKRKRSKDDGDDGLYGHIKKRLHVDVEKLQIIDKVRRLKRKFNNACKDKNNSNRNMNAHDKLLFNLSKSIWDAPINKNDNDNGNGNDNAVDNKDDNNGSKESTFKVGEDEVKGVMRAEALKRMGKKGRNEIREMWRKVANAQLEVDLMRSQARALEVQMTMEALGLIKD